MASGRVPNTVKIFRIVDSPLLPAQFDVGAICDVRRPCRMPTSLESEGRATSARPTRHGVATPSPDRCRNTLCRPALPRHRNRFIHDTDSAPTPLPPHQNHRMARATTPLARSACVSGIRNCTVRSSQLAGAAYFDSRNQ